MQHDSVAAAADGMTEADRAPIDVQPGEVDLSGRSLKAKNLAAELFIRPSRKAAQHLGRERLVQLPGIDVAERQLVALQEFGCRQHRPKAHDAGVKCRPLAVE